MRSLISAGVSVAARRTTSLVSLIVLVTDLQACIFESKKDCTSFEIFCLHSWYSLWRPRCHHFFIKWQEKQVDKEVCCAWCCWCCSILSGSLCKWRYSHITTFTSYSIFSLILKLKEITLNNLNSLCFCNIRFRWFGAIVEDKSTHRREERQA